MQGDPREATYHGKPVQILGRLDGKVGMFIVSFRDGTRTVVSGSDLSPVPPTTAPPRPGIHTKGAPFDLPSADPPREEPRP